MIRFFKNLLQFVRRAPTYYWLGLLFLLVITTLSLAGCTNAQDIYLTDPANFTNWESVSNCKKIWNSKYSNELTIVDIKHCPKRLAQWDENVIVTVQTISENGTSAYIYIRQKDDKNGLRYPFTFTADNQTLKVRIDMGFVNLTDLTRIQNVDLYITDSRGIGAPYIIHPYGNKASSNPYEFEVLFIDNYLSMMGILATVTAVVVALLSLWAQLIARLVDRESERPRKLTATLNLFWIYIAVFIALLSLIAFLSAFSPGIRVTQYNIIPLYFVGWGLLISSIAMVVLSVFESTISIFFKGFCKRTTVFDRPYVFLDIIFISYYKYAFIVLAVFALLLCGSLIWLIADGFSLVKIIWWLSIFTVLGGGGVLSAHIWVAKKYGRK